MTGKLNITVMLGGMGAEREVSLNSGTQAAAALRSLGHSVHELDPLGVDWQLPPMTDVVFLALHGTYGEDGTVQTRLARADQAVRGNGDAIVGTGPRTRGTDILPQAQGQFVSCHAGIDTEEHAERVCRIHGGGASRQVASTFEWELA